MSTTPSPAPAPPIVTTEPETETEFPFHTVIASAGASPASHTARTGSIASPGRDTAVGNGDGGLGRKTGVLPWLRKPSIRTYHDKYVILWDFEGLDDKQAVQEIRQLCNDIDSVGLQTEVRTGSNQSLLVFVRAPRDLLRSEVHKSRVKDWLYGVTTTEPGIGKHGHPDAQQPFEAENLLSVLHLLTWERASGCAGITPGFGRWKNVKALLPIHNETVNTALLRDLSKKLILRNRDLDQIRDLFGSKTAFYFAFMQSYLLFLFFPAATGILAWLFLPTYSMEYAIVTLVACTVFLEYWKIQQTDLAIRWTVRGVGRLKANRPQFKHEQIVVDAAGRTKHVFPRWKLLVRQLLQIPFFAAALVILGSIITVIFVVEIVISEAYEGPYKAYLEYLPTILLAVALPYLTTFLEDLAASLAEFENHRTHDHHDVSVTQKIFFLSSIANYLPSLLTAFLYVPLGHRLIPYFHHLVRHFLGSSSLASHLDKIAVGSFHQDPNRLRNAVIALTVTGQLSDAFQEFVLPLITLKLRGWYQDLKTFHSPTSSFTTLAPDAPAERSFLQSVRHQAQLPSYNVQEDISEMVIQFGHLALFSPVWPLVSVGFLINNWIELRSDFLKICIEHQRPSPLRTDGLGPSWTAALDSLTWLGSITTAAIVHMFSTDGGKDTVLEHAFGRMDWWMLPITIFVSEHVFLGLRAAVRWALSSVGSEQVRMERDRLYVFRKKRLEELEEVGRKREGLDVPGVMERRRSMRVEDPDLFWTRQVGEGESGRVGGRLVGALRGRGKRD